jgi:hypothetical protein
MKNDLSSLTTQQFVMLMNRTGLCDISAKDVYKLKENANAALGERGKVNLFRVCAYLRRGSKEKS